MSRASGSLTFPANFVLVAALNPCPCGYYGDDRQECTCSMSMGPALPETDQRGPLMDRIDIHLEVKRCPFRSWPMPPMVNPHRHPPARGGSTADTGGTVCTAQQAPCPGQWGYGAGRGADVLPTR
ncbi:MAG: ATP-binding protein [Caldilineaceae bacterium]